VPASWGAPGASRSTVPPAAEPAVPSAATFDPGHLARIYDAAAVRAQRAATRALLDLAPGQAVLDLGCGPGHLSAELAGALGADGQVLAVDRQASMVVAARERTRDAPDTARGRFLLGEATALPIADATCDRAVSVQVLEYVPDVPAALRELHRVVRPGGRVVLVDTDWRSCVWRTLDRNRTDEVLRRWESHFMHPQLPTSMPRLLRDAGFRDVAVRPLPVVETDKAEATYSLGMADTIARFVARATPDLAADWREDVLGRAAADDYFFALTRFAVVANR
jgi:arsenite methyltransferase